MLKCLEKISLRQAAIIIGLGIILMAIIAPIAEFAILSENIDTDDLDKTNDNLEENQDQVIIAFLIYLIVLALDIVVALAMYVYFRSVNRTQAILTADLRIVYTFVLFIGLLGLLVPSAAVFIYGQLISYAFFIPHLFVLGYLAYNSKDVPKLIGGILMLGSLCYIFLTYGEYLLSGSLYEMLFMITMLPAVLAELSLAIWMLVKGGKGSDIPSKEN
jgi:hypothetical protein